MHGRLKVRTSEEEKIRKEKERAKKVIAYKSGMALLIKKRTNKEFDEEALTVSAQMLSANPDIYTLWNYRREIILFLKSARTELESSKLFDTELDLTELCLKVNPKSYGSWYQRIWVLITRPDPDWTKELKLCNAYLKLDERNFHCWDYRRNIVNFSKIDADKEFAYSTTKIQENFSNYSAWHYRSKLLTSLFPDPDGVRPIEEGYLRDELELVLNAAFTDPNDTSAWFYQRWLLGSLPKSKGLAVCRVTRNKSVIAFNQSVQSPLLTSDVEVRVNNNVLTGEWKSLSGLKQDVVWTLEHNPETNGELFHQENICVEVHLLNKTDVTVVCKKYSFDTKNHGDIELIPDDEDEYIGYASVEFTNDFGVSVIDELEKQKDSCEQLLELEPDSKWTHLTLAVIKHSINHIENYEGCNEILLRLIELDSKRKNYYKDLYSRWHLEHFIQTNVGQNEEVMNGMFTLRGGITPVKLSTLYHSQYWSACTEIHLNDHQLTSQCLPMMYVFCNCRVLNLSNNCLDSLKGFPALPKLKILFLKGNQIKQEDLDLVTLKCPQIQDIVFE